MKLFDISVNNLLRKKGRTFFLVSGLAIGIGAAVGLLLGFVLARRE